MMRKWISFFIAGFLLTTLPACEKLIWAPLAKDPTANFEFLWEQCRDKYPFFALKQVDWEAIRRQYAGRFSDQLTENETFLLLFDLLLELDDRHVVLEAPFRTSRVGTLQANGQFNDLVVQQNYLRTGARRSGAFHYSLLRDGRIGYIRYASFEETIQETELDEMLTYLSDTDGLILDLRQNLGGSIRNVFRIINRFVDRETLLYTSQLKNGPGPDDFTEPQPAYASPSTRVRYLGKKVMVLTDRNTFSAASFFALAARELPGFYLVGDFSGGGLAIPARGQLPNGWVYQFAVSKTLSPDGNDFELGIPPDIGQPLNRNLLDQGVDSIIERAIREIEE